VVEVWLASWRALRCMLYSFRGGAGAVLLAPAPLGPPLSGLASGGDSRGPASLAASSAACSRRLRARPRQTSECSFGTPPSSSTTWKSTAPLPASSTSPSSSTDDPSAERGDGATGRALGPRPGPGGSAPPDVAVADGGAPRFVATWVSGGEGQWRRGDSARPGPTMTRQKPRFARQGRGARTIPMTTRAAARRLRI
jgi:hypothetical protein